MKSILPNFFIIGAPKSGTTNISYYLKLSSQVFMPENLEPYFFAQWDVNKFYKREIINHEEQYLKLFQTKKKVKAVGESSPVYLYCPNSAKKIKKYFPNAKIIISLRNPIDITYSQYYSLKFNLYTKLSFKDQINYDKELLKKEFNIDNILEAGFYLKHIKRFMEHFKQNQIKIIIFENYIKNTYRDIESILQFLDIEEKIEFKIQDKGAYKIPKNILGEFLLQNKTIRRISQKTIPTVTRQKFGEKYLVKEGEKPIMDSETREQIKNIYQREVKELEKFLNIDLPWNDFH